MNIYWLLLLVIPAWFLWIVAHEGAHVAAAKAYRYKIIMFKPWPHLSCGRFFWGRMIYDGEPNTPIYLAPFILDAAAFALIYPILWLIPAAPEGVITLAVVLSRPLVNTATGIVGRYRQVNPTDLSRVHWGWALVPLALWVVYSVAIGIWIGHEMIPT